MLIWKQRDAALLSRLLAHFILRNLFSGGLPVGSTTRMVSKTMLDIFSLLSLLGDCRSVSCLLCLQASQLFTSLHLGFTIAISWVLLLNSVVWWQIAKCITCLSVKIMIIPSALVLLIITGYITMDTGFGWSGYAPWVQS